MRTRLQLVTVVLGFLFASHSFAAERSAQAPRIGFLSAGDDTPTPLLQGFRQGLKDHGFVEGQTIYVDYRWAQGRFDQLPQLAADLVASGAEVIVATVTAASLAAKAATKTVPVVMVGVADPVGVGLVASLARPGGNVTGTATLQTNIAAKQLELAQAVDPTLHQVAVLWNPANAAFQALQLEEAQAAARALGLQPHLIEASTPDAFFLAFTVVRQAGIKTVVVLTDPTFVTHRDALINQAMQEGLITICGSRDYAEAGCLISYGPSYHEASRRAVAYVAKILAGARPADLPIEQPTRFELVINMKTAAALGQAVPATLLSRADEVIE